MRSASYSSVAGLRTGKGTHERPFPPPLSPASFSTAGQGGCGGETPSAAARRAARLDLRLPARSAAAGRGGSQGRTEDTEAAT